MRELVCAECERVTTGAASGWRACPARGVEEGDEEETIVVFCPACAASEFGSRAVSPLSAG